MHGVLNAIWIAPKTAPAAAWARNQRYPQWRTGSFPMDQQIGSALMTEQPAGR